MKGAVHRSAIQGSAVHPVHSFEHNVVRTLFEVTEQHQQRIMAALVRDYGHDLKLSFRGVIARVPASGIRPSDIAAQLGMQKQNAGRLLKAVEAAGYIAYRPDPDDGRARLVFLSERGQQLLRDGAAVVSAVDADLRQILGRQAFEDVCSQLAAVVDAIEASVLPVDRAPRGALVGDLITLSAHLSRRNYHYLKQRGHGNFKASFRHVMMHVGKPDCRISTIARDCQVSRQAIARVTAEMAALGYVALAPDPGDGRRKVIELTSAGTALVNDTLAAAGSVIDELVAAVGAPGVAALEVALGSLAVAMGNGQVGTAASTGSVTGLSTQVAEALAQALIDADASAPDAASRLLEPTPGSSGHYRLREPVLAYLAGAVFSID